jgi:acyl dehydratase
MYTLALAARYVDEHLGEPGRIAELTAKFTKPVVVPAKGTEVTIAGTHEERDGVRTIALTVTCNGEKVLGNPRAVLRD